MAITLQLVDNIGAAPAVRLDLSAGPWSLLRQPDFSPPPLRRAVASSLLRDGAEIPVSAYDNRVVRLPLRVQAATEDLLAAELEKLNRELDRARNVLKWSSGGTSPVFFRTFRSPDYALELRIVGTGEALIDLPLMAEPFAYGVRVDQAAVTVTNNPATASNGLFLDITGVTGEILTPALIRLDPGDTGVHVTILGIRGHGTPGNITFFEQAEALTAGTETTIQANDAAMSGAGSNFMRTTFGVPNMQTRLSGLTIPVGATGVDRRGTYRVFARVRRSSTSGVITARIQGPGATTSITGETVTVPAKLGPMLIDLGLVTIPVGPDSVFDGYGPERAALSVDWSVQAQRSAGTSNLDWDYFVFVFADEEYCSVDWSENGLITTQADDLILDGPNDTVLTVAAGGSDIGNNRGWPRVGRIPLLRPNQSNRLMLLSPRTASGEGGVPMDDRIGDTTAVSVSFWPRFLWIR